MTYEVRCSGFTRSGRRCFRYGIYMGWRHEFSEPIWYCRSHTPGTKEGGE